MTKCAELKGVKGDADHIYIIDEGDRLFLQVESVKESVSIDFESLLKAAGDQPFSIDKANFDRVWEGDFDGV